MTKKPAKPAAATSKKLTLHKQTIKDLVPRTAVKGGSAGVYACVVRVAATGGCGTR